MRFLAMVCVCLLACFWTKAQAQTPPLPTSAAYARALLTVQTVLARQSALLAHAPSATTDTVPVERVASQVLAPFTLVVAPDGAVQPVNNTVLTLALRRAAALPNAHARASAYRLAAMQMRDLRAELMQSGPAASPTSSSSAAEASVRAVLGRAEFDSEPLPPPSLWERFWAWIGRLLSRRHAPSGPEAPVSPAFIRALLIFVAAGAFAVLVAVLVQWLRGRARLPAAAGLSDEEDALVAALDAPGLRALAEQQAGQGQWRRAFALTYVAALVALETNGILRFDRAKTNWEYVRALRGSGQTEAYAALLPFTRSFDDIWYGSSRADASDYAFAVAQYDSLTASPAPVPAAASAP